MSNYPPPYFLFPFQFSRINEKDEVLLVNEVGEFKFVKSEIFNKLINYSLDTNSQIFLDLKGKHFVTDTEIYPVVDLLATKYRTKKAFLRNFTTLHMVVVTLRCNGCCRYCHASSEPPEQLQWDMTPSIARKVVNTIFQSPAPAIKIEFQGGEPLLNWEVVKGIVQYAELLNKRAHKKLEFVLCTNLILINEDILSFMKRHNIMLSTSLDGPKDIHDKNRILRNGESSYDKFIEKLRLSQKILGQENISALMTTSKANIKRLKEVVDEYIKQGFRGIFLRSLNPYGFAKRDYESLWYDIEEFIESYKETLRYIIKLNMEGNYFEEYYTTLLLTRILTPFSTGFVDLQSPSGAGISGAVYDYNGDVYPADEARMLAKMGNKRFLMGNVAKDNYLDIFAGKLLQEIINNACTETLPGCALCVFQPYCGADPIRNYSEQGDMIGHRPTNDFCKKHEMIFNFLFELIRENNDEVMDVFWSWITKRSLKEIQDVELSREGS